MLHVFKFSGGKDSLATLLGGLDTLPAADIRVVFCDTGWEHPDTYKYIDYVEEKIGIPIVRVKSRQYPEGLAQLALAKGRFPSLKARFCTEKLKVEPGIDYILAQEQDVVVYQGVRADESEARRMLRRDDEYFRFYFEPYKYRSKYQAQIRKLLLRIGKSGAKAGQFDVFGNDALNSQLRELQQLHEVHKRPVYHSYRRQEVLAWCEKHSADVVRPVLKWTAEEVISYCMAKGFKLNPLYYRGAKRVGCYPCINSNLQEIAYIAEQDDWRIQEIAQLEQDIRGGEGSTFFANDRIPTRHQTGAFTRAGVTHRVPLITDVVKYVQGNPDQFALLDQQHRGGCISHYNICEAASD